MIVLYDDLLKENKELRAILKEFLDAEWMVEATWTSSAKRLEIYSRVENYLKQIGEIK